MFLGIANAISGIKSGGLSFIKDNLKLYLDFKSNKSDTLKFPSEGSTSFDGNGDYIDCGDINDMDGASKITIAGWAKRLESNDRVTFEKSTGTGDRIGLNLDTDGVLYANVGTGSGGAWAYASLSGTDWNHIAMVYDGTQADNATRLNIYINGVKQSSSYGNTIPATTASSEGTFKIGRAINNSSYSSTGSATNVAVWSRALTPEEIQSIMNKSYSQLKGVEKTSLVAWWGLDDDTVNGAINSHVPEILGNEIFPTSNSVYTTDGSHYTKDSATPPNLTYQDTGTGTVTINDSDLEESINISATYKLTFTIFGLTSGQANLKAVSTNFGNTYVDETMLDNGTHTFYFIRPAGGGDGFKFRSDTASGSTFTISNYSLKKIT